MIRHVVMFKLHDTADKQAVAEEVKARLDTLPARIDVIRQWEVGLNVIASPRAYDVVLISAFDDIAALQTYQQHPEHVALLEFLKAASASIVAVDYES